MKFRNNIFTVTMTVLVAIIITLLCIISKVSFGHYIDNVNMYHSVVISTFEDLRKKLAVVALQLIDEDEVLNVLKNEAITPEEEINARSIVSSKYRLLNDMEQIIIVNNKKKVFTNLNMLGIALDEYQNTDFDFKAFYKECTSNNKHYITIKDYNGEYNQFFVYEDYRNYLVIFRLSKDAVTEMFRTERDHAEFDTCISYNNEPFAFSGDTKIFEDNILRYDMLSDKKYSIFGERILISDSAASISCLSMIKITDVIIHILKEIAWIALVILVLLGSIVIFLRKYSQKFKFLQIKHYNDISQMRKQALMENQTMAFLKIFYGIHLSSSEQEALEQYLLLDADAVYRFILVKCDNIDKSTNISENDAKLIAAIQNQLQRLGRIKAVKLNEGIIGIILSDKHDLSDEKINSYLQRCYPDICTQTGMFINVFISGKYYGMNDFIEKAPVLLKMQDITFFNKENHIIFDNIYEKFKNIIPYPIQTEQKALEALANSENEVYREQIDRFVGRIKQTTPFVAKCYISILATNIVNYTKMTKYAISEDIISMVEISEDLDKAAGLMKDIVTDVKLATDERDEKFRNDVVDFIERNYTNYDFCVSDLSDYLGVSVNYAGKKFRNKFGQSFNTYLSEMRIEKAAQLLTTTNIKIGKIGEMCGFRTDAYFVTTFKKLKQVSPQEYRNLNSDK